MPLCGYATGSAIIRAPNRVPVALAAGLHTENNTLRRNYEVLDHARADPGDADRVVRRHRDRAGVTPLGQPRGRRRGVETSSAAGRSEDRGEPRVARSR